MCLYNITQSTFQLCFLCQVFKCLSFEWLIEPKKFPFCPSDNVSDTKDFAIVAPLSNALVSEASISFGVCIPVKMLMRRFGCTVTLKGSVMLCWRCWRRSWTCSSSLLRHAGLVLSWTVCSETEMDPDLSFISELKSARIWRVRDQRISADFWRVMLTISPDPLESWILSNCKLSWFKWFCNFRG